MAKESPSTSNDAASMEELKLPKLGEEAKRILGEAEVERWRKARPEDVARQTNRRNCYHCGTEFETCPREEHHIIPLGVGGSKVLDDPRNRVDIDALCHKRAQPSDGRTEPTLRFFRNDAGQLRSLEQVDGEWIELTPYGAFIEPEDVNDELNEVQQLSISLLGHRHEIEQWGDEALKAEYEQAEQIGVAQFLVQCQIIHILAERRSIKNGTRDEAVGIKGAARFLGVAYQTARLRHAVYNTIIAKAPDEEWHGLSATFFYEAYRGAGKVDPVKALHHAQDNVLANPNYSKADFANDIARGLQEKVEDVPPVEECPWGCANCVTAGADAVLEIRVGDTLVARGAKGSGTGQKYCHVRHMLAGALVGNDRVKCGHWKSREDNHAG